MLEITGMFAIAVVLTGSVLVALFAGEALIKWTIAMMSFGMHHADEAAARQSGQAQPVKILSGQRTRLQRI
jgi:hypothetical protein